MEKEVCEKITEQATERIKEILEQGIQAENVEMLGELVDIQKDLEKDGVVYNPKFEVHKFLFEGNTKISSKDLESVFKEENIIIDEKKDKKKKNKNE